MWDFIENHPNIVTDAMLPAVVAIVSAIWGFFRLKVALKLARFNKAIECLEAGVQLSYDTYVREIKAASEDGKLTSEERTIARAKAVGAAITYGKTYGIDLIKELGAEMLPLLIEKAITKLKGNSTTVKTTAPVVQETTQPTPDLTTRATASESSTYVSNVANTSTVMETAGVPTLDVSNISESKASNLFPELEN